MKNNQLNSPQVFSDKGQGKDKYFQGQKKRIFTSFFRHPKTIVKPSKPKCNE